MVVTIIVAVYVTVFVLALIWMGLTAVRFLGNLTDEPLPDPLPKVSTIVPARNEERNIRRCATGIVQQGYTNLEMVFVDDDSEDATGEILAEFAAVEPRMKVINTGGKPTDWNGKQWACWSGYLQSSGEWLCFMDADTYAEPELISRTVAFAEAHNIDMLSMMPWIELRGLWERVVLPEALVALLLAIFPPHRINDPDNDLVIANGQFILIRRSIYEDIDGHRGVRAAMMDDFSLAERLHEAGHRLFIVEGLDVMRVRLYTNLREIWSGAIKAAVQLTGGWYKTLVGLIGALVVQVLPLPLFIVLALTGYNTAALLVGLMMLLQLLVYGGLRLISYRIPPWSAIAYPFGGVVVAGILLDMMIRVARGGEIKWKGRDVMGRPELP